MDIVSTSPVTKEDKSQTADECYSRSPSEIRNHVGVVIHCNSSGTIMTIIRADRGKSILRSVREIFILDTYIDSSKRNGILAALRSAIPERKE